MRASVPVIVQQNGTLGHLRQIRVVAVDFEWRRVLGMKVA